MPDIIRLLPDAIANQIAAGEVVQRPASVVKELLENALDAGATQIMLVIREAGRQLIQVTDNGKGMSETDARMCFERHATSKISTAEDLYAIRTMGFRGEAMASIAAVAQVDMLTRQVGQEVGTELLIEGSQLRHVRPAGAPEGTSVSVRNLFFNTPGRRKFLKSNTAELRHILEEFTRVALARPDVAMTFYRGDDEYLRLAGGKLSQRIGQLFGRSYVPALVPCQESAGFFSVSGYIGKPDTAKKTRGEQFFFVNRRYIRHPFLHHAIASAFEGLLPADFYPFYTLFIEVDPERIDVNVHPTKTEVKFEDERALYAVLFAATRRALADFHVMPPINFEDDVNFGLTGDKARGSGGDGSAENPGAGRSNKEEPARSPFFQPLATPGPGGRVDWRALAQSSGWLAAGSGEVGGEQIVGQRANLSGWSVGRDGRLTGVGGVPLFPISEAEQHAAAGGVATGSGIFQISNLYLAAALKQGLLLIDIAAARERILYERYTRRKPGQAAEVISQQSIFPPSVELSAVDYAVLEEIWGEAERLGFTLEAVGERVVRIAGVPPEAGNGSEKAMLEGLLEQYKYHRDHLSLPRGEAVARALAARLSKLSLKILEGAEQHAVINQLFACAVPNVTPDGRPVTVILGLEAIQGWFGVG